MSEDAQPQATSLNLSPMAIACLSCLAGAIIFGFIGLASESGGLFGLVGMLFIAAIVTGIITLAQRRPDATAEEQSADKVVAAAGITVGTLGITTMIIIVVLVIVVIMIAIAAFAAFMGAMAEGFGAWW